MEVRPLQHMWETDSLLIFRAAASEILALAFACAQSHAPQSATNALSHPPIGPSCAAGVRLGVTTLAPLPRGVAVEQFASREDVVRVLLASCHIPFWVTPWPLARLRCPLPPSPSLPPLPAIHDP